MRTAIWIIWGVATWYTATNGDPLYWRGHFDCGGSTEPFVAIDVRWYKGAYGNYLPGDVLHIYFQDLQTPLKAKALDAGDLERFCVEDWGCDKPIVVDVPECFWPKYPHRSWPVMVVNYSAAKRQLERYLVK